MTVEAVQKILVVDDEQSVRVSLFEILHKAGYEVAVAENGTMAVGMIEKNAPGLVITDIKMPEMDGLQLLDKIRALHPALPVVVITGFATVDSAVEAMKKGAFDYILKPFHEEVILQTAVNAFRYSREQQYEGTGAGGGALGAPQRAAGGRTHKPVIGSDPNWMKSVDKARAVASSKATVLILGESGTGKEVLARFVHNESDRADGPFVALNCAALPDGLLESELFGHEKGAFTGAISTKKGKFELAHGGTLLLDEIGEVPLHLQAKLLRVLQEEEVDRLGGRGPIKFDTHVIATTNRDLSEAVKNGDFRQDLFYRLNVIPVRLPALRERRKDIPLLAEYFIDKYAQQYGKPRKQMSALAKERFMQYDWPGNVREMENMVERAVLLCAGEELEPGDFWDEEEQAVCQANMGGGSSTDDGGSFDSAQDESVSAAFTDSGGAMISLREVERQMIMQALQKTDNNRTHAAKMLGISVRTLRNKLQEYRSKGFQVE